MVSVYMLCTPQTITHPPDYRAKSPSPLILFILVGLLCFPRRNQSNQLSVLVCGQHSLSLSTLSCMSKETQHLHTLHFIVTPTIRPTDCCGENKEESGPPHVLLMYSWRGEGKKKICPNFSHEHTVSSNLAASDTHYWFVNQAAKRDPVNPLWVTVISRLFLLCVLILLLC